MTLDVNYVMEACGWMVALQGGGRWRPVLDAETGRWAIFDSEQEAREAGRCLAAQMRHQVAGV